MKIENILGPVFAVCFYGLIAWCISLAGRDRPIKSVYYINGRPYKVVVGQTGELFAEIRSNRGKSVQFLPIAYPKLEKP